MPALVASVIASTLVACTHAPQVLHAPASHAAVTTFQLERRDLVQRLDLCSATLEVRRDTNVVRDPENSAYSHWVVLSPSERDHFCAVLGDVTSYWENGGVIGCLCNDYVLRVSQGTDQYESVFCAACQQFFVPELIESTDPDRRARAAGQLNVPLNKVGVARVQAIFEEALSRERLPNNGLEQTGSALRNDLGGPCSSIQCYAGPQVGTRAQ